MKFIYNGKVYEGLEEEEIDYMCPIPKSCPVCYDVKRDEEDEFVSKKISAPNVIFEKISAANTSFLLKDYYDKVNQYDTNSLGDFILVSEYSDLQLFKSITNYLNLKIESITDRYVLYENLHQDNKMKLFNEFQFVLKIKNKNDKIKDITSYYEIVYNFKEMTTFGVRVNLEEFSNLINFHTYNGIDNIEHFQIDENIFNKSGKFKIHIYDFVLEDTRVVRNLLFEITDTNRMIADNALNNNIYEITELNNNTPPNYYEIEKVNKFGLESIRRILSKDDFEDYIFYNNEESKANLEFLKKQYFNLKYEHQKTNILYDQIYNNRYPYVTKLNNCISTFRYGEVINIIDIFQFTIAGKEILLYDVTLNLTKKNYRIINI